MYQVTCHCHTEAFYHTANRLKFPSYDTNADVLIDKFGWKNYYLSASFKKLSWFKNH